MSNGDSMHPDSGSNRESRPAGERVRPAMCVVCVTWCLLVHGCSAGPGGAVELSWQLRPSSSELTDKFAQCSPGLNGAGEIAAIELDWSVMAGDAVTTGSAQWRCGDYHGATGFALPPGTADLSIVPICAAGPGGPAGPAAPGTYIAPAPVRRDVQSGEVVSLAAVELVVNVSDCKTAIESDVNFGAQSCICCTVPGACEH
jgi:hypothetical protein